MQREYNDCVVKLTKAARAIEALSLQAAISQHLQHLRILLALFFESKLALLVVVLVLAPASVLATLCVPVSVRSFPVVAGQCGGACSEEQLTFPLFLGMVSCAVLVFSLC